MDASSLLEQIQRLQAQLPFENDLSTQREMRKTIKHLHGQYRKATRHHAPWYGLKRNAVFLVLLFLTVVTSCVRLEMHYGWWYTVSGVVTGAVILVLATGMIFLVMKIISPDSYNQLVAKSFGLLQNVFRRPENTEMNTQAKKPTAEIPNKSSGVAPNVIFDQELPSLDASKHSVSTDVKRFD